MNNEKEIISQIIQARRTKKLSQTQLGEITGNSQQVLSKIERGKSVPNLSTLCRIMDALECEIIVRKPGDKIINASEEKTKAAKEFMKSFRFVDREEYTHVDLKTPNQKEKYQKSVNYLKDVRRILDVGMSIRYMTDTLMSFRMARDIFRKNPNKLNIALLNRLQGKLKSVKQCITDGWIYEINNCIKNIETILETAKEAQ